METFPTRSSLAGWEEAISLPACLPAFLSLSFLFFPPFSQRKEAEEKPRWVVDGSFIW